MLAPVIRNKWDGWAAHAVSCQGRKAGRFKREQVNNRQDRNWAGRQKKSHIAQSTI